ncbi:hypothetical protein HX889_35690 [Pseudomonas reactans]|nr:hypothetical protein [Pseudomonas reactans]
MRKPILVSTLIVALFFTSFYIISLLKPKILIHNNTSHNIYIYFGESTYDVDPSAEEVDKIIKRRPNELMPGQKIMLKPSLKRLLANDSEVGVGWYIGGQYEYNSISTSGQLFKLSKQEGNCSISIIIKSDTAILKKENKTICYQKLHAF